MTRQGTLCWMLVLAPIVASAGDEGPISALDAAANDSSPRVVAQADINLAANDAASTAAIEADGTITLELAIATDDSYWIGLDCEEPGEALRSQLALAENTGLVILDVVENSPAKSAGLLENDVVTVAKLGDKQHAITDVDQFSGLIQQAKSTPIELTVVREGKVTPVTVTPAARAGLTLLKNEQGGRPRALPGQRPGGPAAKKSDGDKSPQRGLGARQDGGRRQRGPGMTRHRGGEQQRGRHHAERGRGGRHQHADRGRGMGGHRGRHPRHMAQRGPSRHAGRMAMMRHGRHGGFGHRGPGRGGFAHRGFGRGGFGQRGFGHGSHFGNRFAMTHRDGRFGGGSHVAMFQNLMRHGRGPQAFQRPVQSQRSTSGIESRLEALVTRLEKVTGPQGLGRIGAGGPDGPGGFRGPFGGPRREGDRPEANRPGPRRDGDRPESNRPGPRGEPGRREASAEGPSLDQMRGQLRRLAEQQENMMKAIRDLSEALEKSSRK